MLYALLIALLTASLYAVSVSSVNAAMTPFAAALAALMTFISIYLPRKFFAYTLQDIAPTVLQNLMQRVLIGVVFTLSLPLAVLALTGGWNDPRFLGELFVYTLIGIFLIQIIGEALTNHVLYLQRTHQYNSNQLFALLAGLALLFFILILYFLAFDLAQPPAMRNYLRDMLAITLILGGYGRAVFLMVHH